MSGFQTRPSGRAFQKAGLQLGLFKKSGFSSGFRARVKPVPMSMEKGKKRIERGKKEQNELASFNMAEQAFSFDDFFTRCPTYEEVMKKFNERLHRYQFYSFQCYVTERFWLLLFY